MSQPEVRINDGEIRGKVDKLPSGKEYFSFLGIPYAKPPVGELRFQPPEPVDKWEGILEATKVPQICIQLPGLTAGLAATEPTGSEDCLYLNVYTPGLDRKLPVMVWIHGGAFSMGDGGPTVYGPQFILEKEIILVTLNYRLDALGFLNLGIPECSGNMGLKDQALAMKWVKNNIENFGGDSNNITIFGESAGASSTALHLISPQSKGLFHKAILQSGSNVVDWACTTNTKQYAIGLAKSLGNDSEDPKELFEFFKNLPTSDFAAASIKIRKTLQIPNSVIVMNPSVEVETAKHPFLTKMPEEYIKHGEINDVPIMAGVTSNEGIIFFAIIGAELDEYIQNPEKSILETNLNRDGLNEKLKVVYDFTNPLNALAEIAGDSTFNYPLIKMVDCLSEKMKSPIYLYCFDYVGGRNFARNLVLGMLGKMDAAAGACHADDLMYLFQSMFTPLPEEGTCDAKVINAMTTLWTNFALKSDPNSCDIDVTWPESSTENYNFLMIRENLTVEQNLFEKRINFWKTLKSNPIPNSNHLELAAFEEKYEENGYDVTISAKDPEQVEPSIFTNRMQFWKSMEK